MTDPVLWGGVVVFALGALLVAWLGRGTPDRTRLLARIATVVPASMGTWYLAMATDWAVRAGDRVVYWGRFADGVTTIPLLVLALGLLADADRTTIATGMVAGGYTMLVTLAASVTTGTAKLAWLAASLAGFGVLLWVLVVPFGRAARKHDDASPSAFGRARAFVVCLFLVYPVLWVLGDPGFALAPGDYLVPARLAVDATLKIGFGVLVLGGLWGE
jgi:bacteriorhodopsin